MVGRSLFLNFARWHIWLGWLVAVPLLLWTFSGLVMVARPIEQVRGEHLRIESAPAELVLPDGEASRAGPVREMRAYMQRGRAISAVTLMDGSLRRYDLASGAAIAPLDANAARELVAQLIRGGDKVARVTLFEADEVPFDFRREMPVWQVALTDGTHVYVGRDSGEIEAVRTRWWRLFDLVWGLHIMDLQTREDTSHPVLILFTALAFVMVVLGTVLMFRRRKARRTA